MRAAGAVVDEEIVTNLGSGGVRRVLDSLWPVDCQACGRPLGPDRPALAVDDLMTVAWAALFHRGCRTSEWNTSGLINRTVIPALSWTSNLLTVPMSAGDGPPAPWPVFVLNPGLESVPLSASQDGSWDVDVEAMFTTGAGLRPAGTREGLQLQEPAPGVIAHLGRGEVALTLTGAMPATYSASVNARGYELISQRGGVLFAVTHALDPAKVTALPQLRPVLTGDRSVAGWVELAQVRDRRPKTVPVPTGRVFQLHYGPGHLDVGPVIAHTSKNLSGGRAKKWAAGMIGGDDIQAWTSLSDGSGHQAMTANVKQFALRHYPDGWRLVQMLSSADGPVAETENEARAWAAQILEFREKMAAPAWQPGPTCAPGVITLYCDA